MPTTQPYLQSQISSAHQNGTLTFHVQISLFQKYPHYTLFFKIHQKNFFFCCCYIAVMRQCTCIASTHTTATGFQCIGTIECFQGHLCQSFANISVKEPKQDDSNELADCTLGQRKKQKSLMYIHLF